MHLWMDYRQPDPTKKKFQELMNDNVEICDLGDRGGDYRFIMECPPHLTVGMEEKTIGALLTDMQTNRIKEQLRGLAEAVDIPILMILGYYSCSFPRMNIRTKYGERNYNWFFLENWLLEMWHAGIYHYRFPSEGAGAAYTAVQKIVSWYNDPEHVAGKAPVHYAIPLLVRDPVIEMLTSIKGVGLARATAIKKEFPKFIDFLAQPFKKLKGAVPDVGPQTINDIFEVFGRPQNDNTIYTPQAYIPEKKTKGDAGGQNKKI